MAERDWNKDKEKLEASVWSLGEMADICNFIAPYWHSEARKWREEALRRDHTTLPTIKPGDKEYVCCECKNSSPSHSWNIATLKIYGSDIHLIEDDDKAPTTLFICPRCGSRVDFNALEVSHD